MRRPIDRGTNNRNGSTLFLFYGVEVELVVFESHLR